ncbi:MAG: VOC family protein [Paracoccus sp. (in: a-proteobacteria)]|uniref:VOC family protein n=1 Tax=Paracoccus sp. TaxID=267 RepID=UPI0026DFD190|nr:VOC family protein [Paracoccus sp. (in: a-proteobacteria)]MDO5633066.1 VOC family protein [Paracoccus sp. (in: a-proteobacteria)]
MTNPIPDTVFGHVRTGYLVVTTQKMADWRRFGAEALGLHMDIHGPDLTTFRVDDRARRLIVQHGPDEDLAGLGLEVTSPGALTEILARLAHRGISVTERIGAEAALRGVPRFWSFVGPKRQRIELFTTAETTDVPLSMLCSGFRTGDAGLCHLAITSKRPDQMIAFWHEIFDARLSDRIEEKISGVNLLVTFLRMNERHHSIAVARTKGLALDPIPTRVQHIALQVADLEDVSHAFERCRALGYKIAMSVGQHTNDREISFYAVSPSGFELEIGWNPLIVDETRWDASTVHQGISVWGHKPLDHGLTDNLRQFRTGLLSLLRKEYQPF